VGLAARLWRLALFARDMARILRTESPDVVHCNSVGTRAFALAVVCRWLRLPTTIKFASDFVWEWVNADAVRVLTIEEAHQFSWRTRVLALLERYGLRQFSLIWAASRYRADTLTRLLRIDPARIRVIPNHIRLPDASYRVTYDERQAGGDPVYLITGGRFVPHKRLEETLAAVARLGRSDVVLRLYGGGHDRAEARVRDLVADPRLEGQIERHTGLSYDAVLSLMAESDIYLSSSIEEGFPITLIEAMAVGLPIVAARRAAVPELVPDGKAGLLYEAGSSDELASVLGRLVDAPNVRRSLGEFGRRHAKQFSIDRAADTYCKLFEDAIGARSSIAWDRRVTVRSEGPK
jgi:glycosyltransferase involved in cell wall biosynthesis